MEQLISRVVEQTISKYMKDRKKDEKKSILYNTETILRNYLQLQYFYNNTTEEHEIVIDCDNEEKEAIVIRSILRNKLATKILIEHVDRNIARLNLENDCLVLKVLYLDAEYEHKTHAEKLEVLNVEFGIDRSEAYKQKNRLIEILGVRLFGIEGLKMWTV